MRVSYAVRQEAAWILSTKWRPNPRKLQDIFRTLLLGHVPQNERFDFYTKLFPCFFRRYHHTGSSLQIVIPCLFSHNCHNCHIEPRRLNVYYHKAKQRKDFHCIDVDVFKGMQKTMSPNTTPPSTTQPQLLRPAKP